MTTIFESYINSTSKPLLFSRDSEIFEIEAIGSSSVKIDRAKIIGPDANCFFLEESFRGILQKGEVAQFVISSNRKGQALFVVTVVLPNPCYNPLSETCWLLNW